MPSIITASTASNTALNFSADTSGVLEIRTGSSPTTALTISTSQVATFVNDASISGLTVGKGGGAVGTNTVAGYQALNSNSTGTQDTAVGYTALKVNTGDYNSAFGAYALQANTSGTQNDAFGRLALYLNTTGSQNAGFGHGTLQNTTTGSANTAVGKDALNANTTASRNTAVGYQALYTNTTGTDKVAVGYQAAYSETTGYGVAVGAYAATANTTGAEITAVGLRALQSNTTGSNNVALGSNALNSNTTASQNTAVGYQAGYAITTSSESTYFGYQAGVASTGTAVTLLGRLAGRDLTSGTNNTFVGHNSGLLMTTGSKNTILGSYSGNQGGLDIRTASNYIVLSDGDGNPRGIFDNNGRFIVGGTSVLTASEITSYNSGNCHLATRNTNASSGFYWRYEVDSSNTIYIINHNSTGVYISNGGTSWTALSDERLKTNLQPIQNAAEKVSRLRAVTGRYKTDNDDVNRAFLIAQDVQAVLPEAVTENSEGYLGLAYTETIPLLVAAIQELKAEVDSLKAQLNNGA